MKILTVYKWLLEGTPAVADVLAGKVRIGKAAQNDPKPNILIMMPDEGEGMSHQGVDGLREAHIVIECHANAAEDAGALGQAVVAAMNNYAGSYNGVTVQLTEPIRRGLSFEPTTDDYVYTAEYTAFYGEA